MLVVFSFLATYLSLFVLVIEVILWVIAVRFIDCMYFVHLISTRVLDERTLAAVFRKSYYHREGLVLRYVTVLNIKRPRLHFSV